MLFQTISTMQYFEEQHQHWLSREFFARATATVARELLGTIFVAQRGAERLAGRIVETEAYLHEGDAASHAFRGKTERNAAMFAQAGTLYVYRIYGIHTCINIVSEEAGKGCAVLIRALEPLHGIEYMQQRRGTTQHTHLCNGPGKTAQSFGFDLRDNFADVCSEHLHILPCDIPLNAGDIEVSKRIGITKSAELPLRFFLRSNPHVSYPRKSTNIRVQ
jgi:DNA-3-methyladenine glycosylase